MVTREKKTGLILEEANAAVSLAYNSVKKQKVKQIIEAVHNELLLVRDEIITNAHGLDPLRVNRLVSEIKPPAGCPCTKLATTVGSAALDLACSRVRYAALQVDSHPAWSINQFALDSLNKLADVLYALARDEE